MDLAAFACKLFIYSMVSYHFEIDCHFLMVQLLMIVKTGRLAVPRVSASLGLMSATYERIAQMVTMKTQLCVVSKFIYFHV